LWTIVSRSRGTAGFRRTQARRLLVPHLLIELGRVAGVEGGPQRQELVEVRPRL
jgi:hypothetical protein